ncbi:MAG: polyprenyl synthetase family protein [Saccharofermentans sp.]|nr:polyprenyl synthetase family protein [Saccharofermentans sp.]
MSDINSLISSCESWITPELESVFDPSMASDVTVKAAMYSLMAGGKRLRPLMMKMTSEMIDCTDISSDVLYYAATLEMIHTYSLIHDDLPAMDNDDLRRGKPTCHKAYGEGFAILAGDLLLNTACERLMYKAMEKPEYAYASYKMANLAGIDGMIGGQSIDLASEDKKIDLDLLFKLQEKKTGALIESAVVTPYYLANKSTVSSVVGDETLSLLKMLAGHIGLAFQIKDDILDVTSSAEVLGKNVGKDQRDEKSTFVTLLGFDAACDYLNKEVEGARKVLSCLNGKGYRTADYETLVDYLVNREK